MPSNDNYRTCICKNITPLDTCWPIVRHFETFWDISSNFEQFWANLSSFGANLSNFEQFWATLSNSEQFWAIFLGQLGSFRAILSIFVGQVWVMSSNSEQFLEARYGIVCLGQCSKCLNWGCFETSYFGWKKVADVNPTDLDPKTRSVRSLLLLLWWWWRWWCRSPMTFWLSHWGFHQPKHDWWMWENSLELRYYQLSYESTNLSTLFARTFLFSCFFYTDA